MSRKLTLQVSEDVYSSILKAAKQTGQIPEVLVVQWLTTIADNLTNDPLERFIGAFKSNVNDWVDKHDKYIGESQIEAIHSKK